MTGPEGTPYEGGYFPCTLIFPSNFPNSPPEMRFLTPEFWHPNVYPDGKVCISILHEAKEDIYNEAELMSEKWRPILSVEAVLVSVQSMLSEPNFSSPANVAASVECQSTYFMGISICSVEICLLLWDEYILPFSPYSFWTFNFHHLQKNQRLSESVCVVLYADHWKNFKHEPGYLVSSYSIDVRRNEIEFARNVHLGRK